MTFDFQLAHACPHLTIEEEVLLGTDRRELRTRQPVASSTHIRITANDELTIPQGGLLAPARLYGKGSGPFKILTGATLTLRNRTQGVAGVLLPTGSRVTVDRIVDVLMKVIRDVDADLLVENRGGYLMISDTSEKGPSSQVSVGGSAASTLGFNEQWRAKGRTVYPSWSFAETPVVQTTRNLAVMMVPGRFPKFNEPVRSNPVFKVTYATTQQHCRRCQAYAIENDYRIAASGEPRAVENEDLLNQGVLKILTTIRNSNPYHPEYGTQLLSRIGTKALGAASATINEDVVTALTVYQRYQTLQGRYQDITPRERLASVISVNTTPSDLDPTVFSVEVVASNAANVPVVVTTVYAAPGTAALAGSNGLSLGLQGFGLPPGTRSIAGV